MRRINLLAIPLIAACKNDTQINVIEGEMEASPNLIDLGDVVVGTETDATVHLVHTGGQALSVLAGSIQNVDGDAFTFDEAQLPVDLPVNGVMDINVHYAPDEVGWHRSKLTLVNNGYETNLPVDIRAHAVVGIANVYPRLLDFGNVAMDQTRTLTVTVVNEGATDLSIAGATFDESGFTAEESFPVQVGVGDSVDLEIAYESADGAAVRGTLVLDLGDYVSVADVEVAANDCANGVPSAYDLDKDGFSSCAGDCDDNEVEVNPGGSEGVVGDTVDNDCDGQIDEGTDLFDDDLDGQTDAAGDCNDSDKNVNTSILEDCDNNVGPCTNGIDDNCDGQIDYGSADADLDGYSEVGKDCNDLDITVFPGAPELADGKDNDCDNTTDEGTTNADDDGDGKSEAQGDCDDTDNAIAPGKAEIADFKDNDCKNGIDDGTVNADDDGDGFSEVGGDCNDANNAVSPAQREISGNGVNEDCDTTTGP